MLAECPCPRFGASVGRREGAGEGGRAVRRRGGTRAGPAAERGAAPAPVPAPVPPPQSTVETTEEIDEIPGLSVPVELLNAPLPEPEPVVVDPVPQVDVSPPAKDEADQNEAMKVDETNNATHGVKRKIEAVEEESDEGLGSEEDAPPDAETPAPYALKVNP